MKKTLIFITLIVTLSFGIVACDKTVIMDLQRPEIKTEDTFEQTNDSQNNFENFYSFSFRVDEDEFYLPMTYAEILELGWSCGLTGDESVLGGLPLENMVFSKGESRFTGTLKGTTDYYVPSKEMVLTAMNFVQDSSPNTKFELPKDIIVDEDSKDTVIEKVGQPQEKLLLEEENNNMMYLYPYDIDENIMIVFDSETEIAIEASLTKHINSQGFEKVPEAIRNYEYPKQLSQNLKDQTFQIDDTIYKMPIPVSYFLENGYIVEQEGTNIPSSKTLSSGETISFNLAKNELKLYVVVENFAAEEKTFSDCYVTRVTLMNEEGHNIKITPELDLSISLEEFEKFIENYQYKKEDYGMFFGYTVEISDRSSTNFYFDGESKALELVEFISVPQ